MLFADVSQHRRWLVISSQHSRSENAWSSTPIPSDTKKRSRPTRERERERGSNQRSVVGWPSRRVPSATGTRSPDAVIASRIVRARAIGVGISGVRSAGPRLITGLLVRADEHVCKLYFRSYPSRRFDSPHTRRLARSSLQKCVCVCERNAVRLRRLSKAEPQSKATTTRPTRRGNGLRHSGSTYTLGRHSARTFHPDEDDGAKKVIITDFTVASCGRVAAAAVDYDSAGLTVGEVLEVVTTKRLANGRHRCHNRVPGPIISCQPLQPRTCSDWGFFRVGLRRRATHKNQMERNLIVSRR